MFSYRINIYVPKICLILITVMLLSLFSIVQPSVFILEQELFEKREMTYMSHATNLWVDRETNFVSKNTAQVNETPECKCQQGASCFENTAICLCPSDYIGQFCEQAAENITAKKTESKLNQQNFTYFYFQPQQQNYFYMEVQICVLKGIPNVYNWLYVDIENKNGSFTRNPSQSQSANFSSISNKCGTLYIPLWPYVMKQNKKMQKLIFGIKVIQQTSVGNQSEDSQQQLISIQCHGSVFLSQAFWWALIIAFVSIFLIMLIFSVTICIRQRLLNRNGGNQGQNQQYNIDHFDKIMPSRRYSNFIQEQLQEVTEKGDNNNTRQSEISAQKSVGIQNQSIGQSLEGNFSDDSKSTSSKRKRKIQRKQHECAICLADIQANQMIRMTICRHIFHQQCLDKWCVKHITCPICRSGLSKSQAEIKLKQTTNIRQPMLQNQHQ